MAHQDPVFQVHPLVQIFLEVHRSRLFLGHPFDPKDRGDHIFLLCPDEIKQSWLNLEYDGSVLC